MVEPQNQVTSPLESILSGYGGEDMPLGGYSVLLGIFLTGFAAFISARRDELPDRLTFPDIVLTGIATHKIARIVTKDWVTSPLRAPFTTYIESTGSGEVTEKSRGKGMQRAIGDLLTCPFCIGPWIAGLLTSGLVVAPRITRFVEGTFAAVTISDYLHHVYTAAREAVK